MTSVRLATLTQRRFLISLCLDFASDLPLALTSGTLLQAVSNAGYWALAVTDKHVWSMAAAVFGENMSRDEMIPAAASRLSLVVSRAGATKNNVLRRQRPAFGLLLFSLKVIFLFMSQE